MPEYNVDPNHDKNMVHGNGADDDSFVQVKSSHARRSHVSEKPEEGPEWEWDEWDSGELNDLVPESEGEGKQDEESDSEDSEDDSAEENDGDSQESGKDQESEEDMMPDLPPMDNPFEGGEEEEGGSEEDEGVFEGGFENPFDGEEGEEEGADESSEQAHEEEPEATPEESEETPDSEEGSEEEEGLEEEAEDPEDSPEEESTEASSGEDSETPPEQGPQKPEEGVESEEESATSLLHTAIDNSFKVENTGAAGTFLQVASRKAKKGQGFDGYGAPNPFNRNDDDQVDAGQPNMPEFNEDPNQDKNMVRGDAADDDSFVQTGSKAVRESELHSDSSLEQLISKKIEFLARK
jgi:hypothetical protein